MRVLHVVEVTHGGVVTYVRALAAAQVAAGHDVHVLAPSEAGAFAGTRHRWEPRRRKPWTLASQAGVLRSLVSDVQPDVVHLHSFFSGLIGRMRRLGVPVVYQPHSWAMQAVPAVFSFLVVWWEKVAAKWADVLLVNCESEGVEGARSGIHHRRTVSVGVPIDTHHFRPPTSAEVVPRSDVLRLLCVGRLSSQKGQAELASAWEENPVQGAELVFVGPGDPSVLQDVAPASFGESLRWVGAQNDVRSWFWGSAVAVMPSRYEGQSVAMAEAMACGLPVVMTAVNGSTEGLDPNGPEPAGVVVPIGEYDELLAGCRRLVGDQALRKSFGAAARKRAVSLFEERAVTAAVLDSYRTAVELHGERRARA